MHATAEAASFSGDNARVDHATAALVERGVEFQHTLGKTVASAYFRKNRVPPAVVQRILGSAPARRHA